jgi:WD40 repeat protein
LRIFLSYAHDQSAAIAARLAADLKLHGHEVWFDKHRLRVGNLIDQSIADGIDRVSADPRGRFILLMTPHSVGRSTSYCLDELERARARRLKILLIKIADVESPLRGGRVLSLDMRDCVPLPQREEQYKAKFQELLNALDDDASEPYEGVQARLERYLQPLPHRQEVHHLLNCFHGREWIERDVHKWLASGRKVFWITGTEGVGKSAIAAWLFSRHAGWIFHNFRYGHTDRTDPRKALFTVAWQLTTHVPEYRDRVNRLDLDDLQRQENLATIFERLFKAQLFSLDKPAAPIVVILDAIDEATADGRNPLAAMLGKELTETPDWFRVLLTSRPQEREIREAFEAIKPWELEAGGELNLNDIREYLRAELRPFSGGGEIPRDLVEAITARSEGKFRYVTLIRQALEEKLIRLGEIPALPPGLTPLYREFFERQFPDPDTYRRECRPLVEVICAARSDLTIADIAGVFELGEPSARSRIARLGSLFLSSSGLIRPTHASLRDWLTEHAPDDYMISAERGHSRLAEAGWNAYAKWRAGIGDIGLYFTVHLPAHLAVSGRKEDLAHLLLDASWVRRKLQISDVIALEDDFGMMRGHGEFDWLAGAVQLSAEVISKDASQFVPQLIGRLQAVANREGASGKLQAVVSRLVDEVTEPWLRPLRSGLRPPGTGLIRRWNGHSGAVECMALCESKGWLVSASSDRTVKVWEISSGRLLRALAGHSEHVYSVSVTPDGTRGVSGAADGSARLWDLTTGVELRSLATTGSLALGVKITADGRRVVSATPESVQVWDAETGDLLHSFPGGPHNTNCLELIGGERRAIVALGNGDLVVLDISAGIELRRFRTHVFGVSALAITRDERLAVTASSDLSLMVWDVESGTELRTILAHFERIEAVAVHPDGQRIFSSSGERTLRTWNIATGREQRTLHDHSHAIESIAISRDGKLMITGSTGGVIRVWDLTLTRPVEPPFHHTGSVSCVAVNRAGTLAVTGSVSGDVWVWKFPWRAPVLTLRGHVETIASVCLSNDEKWVLSSSFDGTLRIWHLPLGRELNTLRGHGSHVSGAALSVDGKRAVSTSLDHTRRGWDCETGKELFCSEGHNDQGDMAASDCRLAVSGAWDHSVRVWDMSTGADVQILIGHTSDIRGVAISPDGRRVVSSSHDRTLRVWDVASGTAVLTIDKLPFVPSGVVIHAEQPWIAFSAGGGNLQVRNLETGAIIAETWFDAAASCCAFAGDNRLVAGDGEGQLHVLSLEDELDSVRSRHDQP